MSAIICAPFFASRSAEVAKAKISSVSFSCACLTASDTALLSSATPGFRPYWIIQADSYQEKTMLAEHLRSNGIESRSWWPMPLSQMPAFSDLTKLGSGGNSRYFSDTHLGLPIWRKITSKEIFTVSSSVKSFYNNII
jgi:dTDP-4-amino-4,6-dideoxygalactose transaminase